MNRELSYNDIGYGAATFKVDETTIAKLKEKYLDPATNKVDVNDKKLAVKLTGDNTVGFGTAEAVEGDALFGFIVTYEQDGYAAIQYKGFMEAVPVEDEIAVGKDTLAVNDEGVIEVVETAKGRGIVTKASTSSDKFINVYVG